MGIGHFFHAIGAFLLLVTAALLLVSTVSSPVTTDIGMLKVVLSNSTDIRNSSINFGTFGSCTLDVPPDSTDQDVCGARHIGYDPIFQLAVAYVNINGPTGFNDSGFATNYHVSSNLTKVQILHPICAALAFIAFILVIIPSAILGVLGAFVALITWVLTLVVMATDLALWLEVRHTVNSNNNGFSAHLSYGTYTVIGGMVAAFLGFILVTLTCCIKRREKKNNRGSTYNNGNGYNNGHDARYGEKKQSMFSRRRRH